MLFNLSQLDSVDSLASACILARTSLSDASCACATSFASPGKFRTYRASANSSSVSGRGDGKTSSLGSAASFVEIGSRFCFRIGGTRAGTVSAPAFAVWGACVGAGCVSAGRFTSTGCDDLPDLSARASATTNTAARAPARPHRHHVRSAARDCSDRRLARMRPSSPGRGSTNAYFARAASSARSRSSRFGSSTCLSVSVIIPRVAVPKPQGLKCVRENWYRPFGTRSAFPLLPGTHVPGYHIPPPSGLRFGNACSTVSPKF
jgi:hypothetical protein